MNLIDKKYFLIDYPLGNHGFFSQFNFAMGQLDFAYSNNLLPIIDWSSSQLSGGHGNLFEMLFNNKFEIGNITDENSILCPRAFEFIVKDQYYVWPVGYPPRCEKIFRMKEIVKHINFLFNNFFEVKSDVINDIPIGINDDVKILGVHCRRSDMGISHPENVFVKSNEDFYNLSIKVFESGDFDKLYLATEEQEILDYFLERMPNKIIYQNCKRIKKGEDTFWDKNFLENGPLVSRQVLIDSLSLSKCNSLLTSISGVTYGSIFFNGLQYENVYYFDEIK